MKKTISTWLMAAVVMMLSATAQAGPVSLTQAKSIARQFVSTGRTTFKGGNAHSLRLAHEAKSPKGVTDYYVFNRGQDEGFVVVSGDDRVQPVWGYCDKGSFDLAALPDNVKWWFEEYQRQMQFLRDHPEAHGRKKVQLDHGVTPLMSSLWNQNRPFNDMCPIAPAQNDPYLYYGGRACTGCVATATSQIMYFWQWPKQGRGSHSYNCDVAYYDSEIGEASSRQETLSADFSQSIYQWDLMRDEYLYTGEFVNGVWVSYIMLMDDKGRVVIDSDGRYGNAVAKLMSDVGIAVEMEYGANGSGAVSHNVYTALRKYFGYLAGYAVRDDYHGDWDSMLREELDNGRPIYYSGSGDKGGHAFVFDGYDNEGRFHVNWGWGGSCDGYFESLALEPYPEDDPYLRFNSSQEVITSLPYKPLTSNPLSGTTIDFGIVPMDSAVLKTINLQGMYLSDNLVVDIMGPDAFNFQVETSVLYTDDLNREGGTILEVVYFPALQGTHSAQMTITPRGTDLYGQTIEPITFTLRGRMTSASDVNLDGEVNLADVNAALNLVLTGAKDAMVGDVNMDGEINIADVNTLINIVLAQ